MLDFLRFKACRETLKCPKIFSLYQIINESKTNYFKLNLAQQSHNVGENVSINKGLTKNKKKLGKSMRHLETSMIKNIYLSDFYVRSWLAI